MLGSYSLKFRVEFPQQNAFSARPYIGTFLVYIELVKLLFVAFWQSQIVGTR